jgi:CubicO group peptidase (beta-lactamase class C family)
VVPELASDFHPDFQGVTLAHLLSHRAGLAANPDYRRLAAAGDVGQQRIESVRMAFADKPTGPVGQTYLYSNWGYIIAGAMVERVTGTTWEQVLTDRVFRPLGMASAGFGGIGTPGLVDQPWGHGDTGQPVPGNGPEMDNPPVLGPAGRVHCTIQDWALYIADLLRGLRGEPALLAAQTCRVLVTPPFGGEYALGWIAVEREWAGGTALTHTGSNNMFIATVWMAPEKDFAVLVCANQGLSAMEAVDTVAGELIRMHG